MNRRENNVKFQEEKLFCSQGSSNYSKWTVLTLNIYKEPNVKCGLQVKNKDVYQDENKKGSFVYLIKLIS